MKNIEKQILGLIHNAQSILVMPSSPPDGDSLGCAVAVYLALRQIGKNVTVVCADPVPDVFKFLPMISSITNEFTPTPDFIITLDTAGAELSSLESKVEESKINIILTAKNGRFSADQVSFSHGENRYDLIITVDTAALQQLGRFYEDNVPLFSEIPVINIDHHATNDQFGRINYVDVMSSSTAELVLSLLESMEQEYNQELINEDIATLLLAGVITDTGSFQNSNTNPKSFSNSAKLIKRGAHQQDIIQHVYKTKHLSTLRLWGRVLSNIRIEKPYKFLYSVITRKDLLDTGSRADETGSIVDELMSNAPDTDIVLLLKEREDGLLTGSMRTLTEGVDASEIAAFFGGGGHAKAAGFRIKGGTFAKDGHQIIEKIKQYQINRLNLVSQEDFEQVSNDSINVPELQTTEIKQKPSHHLHTTPSDQPTTTEETEITDNKISKKDKTPKKITPGVKYHFEN
ncbi:DHH family phosphoesterase [Candidatus Peregrinibacteria bacterium]|nr:DHH family phosphoesterase [Candidatus Peregrinibacteria bacterium]